MNSGRRGKRPLSLQTRLMVTVIGYVSIILVIIATITGASLSRALEVGLDERLNNAVRVMQLQTLQLEFLNPQNVSTTAILSVNVPYGIVFGVSQTGLDEVVVVTDDLRVRYLDQAVIDDLAPSLAGGAKVTESLPGFGSYRMMQVSIPSSHGESLTMLVGLSRADNIRTITELFSIIVLATLGGLILLALTTAITIRVGLRPLRAVAATATRAAAQPLDQGAVSITERVPLAQADPRTETGLVGASLNTLLDHVDSSIAVRQRNEERMRRFVADASHELRTPLASIRGYSELSLRERSLPEGTHTALERIQAQSLRMGRLVEDLLLLARLDEGQELVRGTVDLAQLAVEALADARPTAPDHHWVLDVPADPVRLPGDTGRLQQVVTNLLANAATHTPAGTTVTLRVGEEQDNAVLSVSDDGPGMPSDTQEELFARFSRGDVSRARQTGGTGLGLAIVKAIVEGHSGSISVESSPGQTTFTVRVPRHPKP